MEELLTIKLTHGDLLYHIGTSGEVLQGFLKDPLNDEEQRTPVHQRNLQNKKVDETKIKQSEDITNKFRTEQLERRRRLKTIDKREKESSLALLERSKERDYNSK